MTAREFSKISDEMEDAFCKGFKEFSEKLNSEMQELKKSVQFMSDKHDEVLVEMKALGHENSELKEANQALADRQTDERIVALEQYTRNRNVEIKGVPRSSNENLQSLVEKIGQAIGEPIKPEDLHCVPTKNVTVLQLKHRSKRNLYAV